MAGAQSLRGNVKGQDGRAPEGFLNHVKELGFYPLGKGERCCHEGINSFRPANNLKSGMLSHLKIRSLRVMAI